MARRSKFSAEVHERTAPMVFADRAGFGTAWETILSIAEKMGRTTEHYNRG